MPTPTHDVIAFRRDLLKLLGLPLVVLGAILLWWRPWTPITFAAGSADDVFALASGVWDWTGADSLCLANPHTITFAPDHSVMYLAHRQPWKDAAGVQHRVTEYEIQAHDSTQIRGLIRGETRRTDAGVPVVWDLVLTSPNSYAWHRTDWPATGRTKDVKRCPSGTDSLVQPP